jgi:hypothetical protein
MGARFAGSQRLGDRRRRRLAVETDNLSATAGWSDSLPAPAGMMRTAQAPHVVREATVGDDHSLGLAAVKIIPPEWWKYVAAATASLAITAGILLAGWRASDLAAALGAGIEGLFRFPAAPVAKWYGGVLLSLAGQLALLIWWARSQSHKDFEGRYWLWIRVACVWFILSGCVANDAQSAVRETLRHLWPEISSRTANLGWLVPTWGIGAAIVLPLAREMRGCRWSRSLLLLAAGFYLAAGGLHIAVDTAVPPAVRQVVVEASLLAGHQGLFFSMWLHARHVLYCTVDPAIPSKSRWNIPRPHFRLPRLRLKRKLRPEPRETEVPAPRVNRTPARKEPAPKPPEETEPIPRAAVPAVADDSAAEAPIVTTEGEADDEGAEQSPSKPDLRGLSKKQRRRLMQELRERERAAGQ